jgi:adenosylmethionine-8-amino-7-oxononanoate aminotransferase
MELNYIISGVNKHQIIKTNKYWTYTGDTKLIDLLCGNTSFIFGYNNRLIVDKMIEVQTTVGFLKGLSNETCGYTDELISFLCKEGNFYSVAWAVSGSDGVELAIYINDQYWKSLHEDRPLVVVFNPGYHGTTFLTRSFRNQTNIDNRSISIDISKFESEESALHNLISLLKSNKKIGAIMMEACPWANGISPWSSDWWRKIRKICNEYNLNFIVDDVFAGVGKLGHYFSHNRYGVQPDIAVLGKSLTNGYSPLSCACVNEKITKIVQPSWDYSHTWSPNMGGIGAALAVKDIFNSDQIFSIESKLKILSQKFLEMNLIKNYVVIGLLVNFKLLNEYPTDFLIKNGINGFVSDGGNLKICAPAIADDEYFNFLETNLTRALLGK